MTQFKFGMEAIESAEKQGGGSNNNFAKFPSGTTYKVKLGGLGAVMSYYGYGIYRNPNVPTFAAKRPSKRNKNKFVESEHTPWDLASQHYYDKAFELTEGLSDNEARGVRESSEYKELTSEGYKFAGKQRFAVGLVDIESGLEIVIDFTEKQFTDVIKPIIVNYDKNKDQAAFTLSKEGQRRDTKVTIMPIFSLDELTDKERANFDKFVEKDFDLTKFEGIVYEMDDDEQIEKLIEAGFDISLIGLEEPKADKTEDAEEGGDSFDF